MCLYKIVSHNQIEETSMKWVSTTGEVHPTLDINPSLECLNHEHCFKNSTLQWIIMRLTIGILIVVDKDKKSERERCQEFSQSLLLESAVPPTAAQEVALRQVPILGLSSSLPHSLSLPQLSLLYSILLYIVFQYNALYFT